ATSGAAQVATPEIGVERVGSGFSRPIFVTAPPGDTARLFVVEQHSGRIRILNLASLETEADAFLTVTGLTRGNEQGLLGLAFHPNYPVNGLFYVNYTTTGGGPAGHTEIVRFKVSGDPKTSNIADVASKTVLLSFNQPEENHNGGWLGFGLDGFLYISTGDGGGANDRHGTIGSGQDRNTLLGKILRIDVDNGSPYGIPEGNPFKGDPTKKEEIWAFELRNPWRCAIDRTTGDLWIGDVGQNAREEIDFIPSGMGGLNFGWRPREGLIQTPAYPNEQPVSTATGPVHDYGRSLGISVTGGYTYRGQAIPSLRGSYIFADYGTARFWTFSYDGGSKTDFLERTAELNSGSPKPIGNVSSFGEDANGELYICDLADGEIYKIIALRAELTITDPAIYNGAFTFRFNALPGKNYTVEQTASLVPASWQTFTNVTTVVETTDVIISDALNSDFRFYRVRAE
ncbi:MAG: PQQ-dependent sugar dehydrogenase, partial [Verrucomicrobiales bacterium]|nr:PQQ-dependent sugar dehydrogenase [Verrucomicrobiales bacterium]